MILPSLPCECLIDVLSHLDRKSLYNCLSVNRYYCKLSIPIIWRKPFLSFCREKSSLVINTLLACLDEDEISSLIPCVINFNNQSPLFEYCKFVRKINHDHCVNLIKFWLNQNYDQDCRKLVNTIYHAIMRHSSNLRELNLNGNYLPKISILTTYKPGITNLRSIKIKYMHDQKATEFLSIVPKFCNGIINFDLYVKKSYISTTILDIIKSQPLERTKCYNKYGVTVYAKKIIDALEFRSETLKELVFDNFNFQGIDLSFISRFGCLERLELHHCRGFTYGHYKALSKKNLCLKELRLCSENKMGSSVMEGLFDILYSEAFLKLSLNIITPKIVKIIKESCPNIYYLSISNCYKQSLDLIISSISSICELPSLRILWIQIYNNVAADILAIMLGDYLTFVECLYLDAHINLSSFEYFTNNCKSNLIKWNIMVEYFRADRANYLRCVDDFQKVHNSLNVLGIAPYDRWTDKELEIIRSLENQGVNVTSTYVNHDIFKF